MDGAQQLRVVCVSQGEGQQGDAVLAKASLQVRGRGCACRPAVLLQ